jgi:hypothetical protein
MEVVQWLNENYSRILCVRWSLPAGEIFLSGAFVQFADRLNFFPYLCSYHYFYIYSTKIQYSGESYLGCSLIFSFFSWAIVMYYVKK